MILGLLSLIYGLCALFLSAFSLGQGLLLWRYWRTRHQSLPPAPAPQAWPDVTVQLPIYNEQSVVERLAQAVCALDYPPERLHIQFLDDSTDSTSDLLAAALARQQRPDGPTLEHLRRAQRTGYKAGALTTGLKTARGPFVAIFDADFVPPRDFLRRTVPYLLADEGLAVVQTRWTHLNDQANALTRAQALAVDGHFVVEQAARQRSGWFVPFNGSGGVWRVRAIEASGGWLSRTLTEDLDLSYRAQLAGWRALYLPDVAVPGELPPQLAAYRQQQARWAQGDVQCLALFMCALWRAPLPLLTRLMALHHLFQYLAQPLMLLLLLLTPPLLLLGALSPLLAPLGLFSLIPPLLYAASQRALYPDWRRRLLAFPVLLLLATGMVWSNTWAVVRALSGHADEFKRTPKFAQEGHQSSYALRGGRAFLSELALALYALGGAFIASQTQPTAVPYLLIYVASLLTVGLWDAFDQWRALIP
ncbi:MAG: glycosyltransferase [Anaerolineae bacterium]|nr:glycosyltransferase [Anaerolineae bacterium]MDW8172133.1 glycosyltransferase [Anaerolineae bacterium]